LGTLTSCKKVALNVGLERDRELRGVVGESFHCFFKLDVKLSLGKDFAHVGDVLQEVFV